MKSNCTRFAGKNSFLSRSFFASFLLLLSLAINAQQYTESFSSAPSFTPDPITATWMEKATVTLGRTAYDFVTGGNGGWEYKISGGAGNSADLFYSTASTTTVTIKRRDGKRFQFYGAWLSYSNLGGSYTPPWLRVTYEGSALPIATYANNSTVTLTQNVNVTSVSLYFSGLHDLNFDNVIVGPATPIAPISVTNEISEFTDNSAMISGLVTDDGGSAVTESGLVYGTSPLPTSADNKIPLSTGVRSFSKLVTDLQSSTTYFVRSYAINSAGTAYGNEESFTTFGALALTGSHNFNSPWVSSISQPSPFTKYIEGWDVSGKSSGAGLISIYRLMDEDVAEGIASLRVAEDVYTESLEYMSIKTHNLSVFNLQSFVYRYDAQQIDEGAAYGTITVTGYRNGIAVPGATQNSMAVIPLSQEGSYHMFTVDANNFKGIDEFRLSASGPINDARLYGFDLDEIVTEANTTLPVTYTSVKAYRKNAGTELEWKVSLESDVDHYEIEKSLDGKKFVTIGRLSPTANNYSSASYNWFDAASNTGSTYYRVKSVFKTGTFTYSQIMNITSGVDKANISVYPNPVSSPHLNLKLNNQPKGTYDIQLFSNMGQRLLQTTIEHPGGSATQTIDIDSRFVKGIYEMRITGPASSFVQRIIRN